MAGGCYGKCMLETGQVAKNDQLGKRKISTPYLGRTWVGRRIGPLHMIIV